MDIYFYHIYRFDDFDLAFSDCSKDLPHNPSFYLQYIVHILLLFFLIGIYAILHLPNNVLIVLQNNTSILSECTPHLVCLNENIFSPLQDVQKCVFLFLLRTHCEKVIPIIHSYCSQFFYIHQSHSLIFLSTDTWHLNSLNMQVLCFPFQNVQSILHHLKFYIHVLLQSYQPLLLISSNLLCHKNHLLIFFHLS